MDPGPEPHGRISASDPGAFAKHRSDCMAACIFITTGFGRAKTELQHESMCLPSLHPYQTIRLVARTILMTTSGEEGITALRPKCSAIERRLVTERTRRARCARTMRTLHFAARPRLFPPARPCQHLSPAACSKCLAAFIYLPLFFWIQAATCRAQE